MEKKSLLVFFLMPQVPIPPDMLIDASVADTFGQYEGDKSVKST